MASLSSIYCYAALSACADGEPKKAFLRMVVELVFEKKYREIKAQSLVRDFQKRFEFELPYHPMQTIIDLGIKTGFFEYNSSLKKVFPVMERISSEDFAMVAEQKCKEYKVLLQNFGLYLQKTHNLFCSEEDLSDKVQAFIGRHGLASKIDKAIIKKVKTDYYFAEYLLYCEEIGDSSIIDFVDQYITGCAFAEVLTYNVPTERDERCKAKVYLDSGVIFALLGIGSIDRSSNFRTFIDEMKQLGMSLHIYQHTYSEIAGIIDSAKNWIGDPRYNPAQSSEAAYFFITNNWSYQQVTELLGKLKTIIEDDFKITIDSISYPKTEDIHSLYEADIKDRIVCAYEQSNPSFSLNEKEYTVNQDARSLFLTLFLDEGNIAHSLSDVGYIFVTTNHTLAKIGSDISFSLSGQQGNCIPIAISDINWGTLIWFNSPVKVSALNKANLISAAYAAFQPSEAVLRKLNAELSKLQENESLSAELCYFLKTNAIALGLLAKKTHNDEDAFFEKTPYEILQEIQDESYNKGAESKQTELDHVIAEKQSIGDQLNYAEKKNVLDGLIKQRQMKQNQLKGERDKLSEVKSHITTVRKTKERADAKIKTKLKRTNKLLTAAWFIFAGITIYLTFINAQRILQIIFYIPTFFSLFLFLRTKFHVSPENVDTWYQKRVRSKVYNDLCFSQENLDQLLSKQRLCENQIEKINGELEGVDEDIRVKSPC